MTRCPECFCAKDETCDCSCHKKGKVKRRPEPRSVRAARKQLEPSAPRPLPKLSEATPKRKYFCYCSPCNKGYENDVDTSHPKCPDCGIQMMNMAQEAILNAIKQREAQKRRSP